MQNYYKFFVLVVSTCLDVSVCNEDLKHKINEMKGIYQITISFVSHNYITNSSNSINPYSLDSLQEFSNKIILFCPNNKLFVGSSIKQQLKNMILLQDSLVMYVHE